MKILVSNDDGYQSEGVVALAQAAAAFGEVRVVAPERDRSAVSNSLTLDRPMRIRQAANGFYFVNGTPTDCVHLALFTMPDFQPDVIVSGINHGANMGDDTLYSGTVAAATEGYFLGIPALAFSVNDRTGGFFDTAAWVASRLLARLSGSLKDAPPFLWNVNVPACAISDLQGMQVTRLGRRHHTQCVMPARNPKGEEVYWIGPAGEAADKQSGTDFAAIDANQVSITPLMLDLTAHAQRESVRAILADTPFRA